MAVVNYYSHIPLIRLGEIHRNFGPGALWQLPFDTWNALTGGSFEDHRAAYERTAPVFLFLEGEVDWDFIVKGKLTQRKNLEIKKASNSSDTDFEQLGFAFLTQFLDQVARTAQIALTLAAPSAAPANPRSSMLLCTPDDAYFRLQDEFSVARIQGDADHEWLLLPEASGSPLTPEAVDFASSIWRFSEGARADDLLGAAIDALLLCSEPTLPARDQMVVATIALEALLLPEARSQLGRTFTRRLTVLLSAARDDTIEAAAQALYDARSAALHGVREGHPGLSETLVRKCGAQQLLASAVLALGPSVLSGVPIAELRERLDAGNAPEDAMTAPLLDLGASPLRTPERLSYPKVTSAPFVITSGAAMQALPGQTVSWSPLLGLGCDEALGARELSFAIVPLNPEELIALEERDIARDFINKLRANPALSEIRIACIALINAGPHDLETLQRRRSVAVATLRLAGYTGFVDPSLLGWYIFEGSQRFRLPTVLRQSILMTLSNHQTLEHVSPNDQAAIDASAQLMTRYTSAADPEVDRLLGEFLRAHPNPYTPSDASIILLFAIVEEVLGRFRPRDSVLQLEDLVHLVANPVEANWFEREGRDFRNVIAHGRLATGETEPRLAPLLAITREIMRALLGFIVAKQLDGHAPIAAFRRSLEAQAGGNV